jgi:6-phospho-3-hexuloisomerase
MSTYNHLRAIASELSASLADVRHEELDRLTQLILGANRVYLAGAGRSGAMIAAFANRLGHLGKPVALIGEISSPHARPTDGLIIGSKSGNSERLVALAATARANGLRVGVVTSSAESRVAQYAEAIVVLGSSGRADGILSPSIQPMGSAFEQLSLLAYDAIVLELMDRLGESATSMEARHANLE